MIIIIIIIIIIIMIIIIIIIILHFAAVQIPPLGTLGNVSENQFLGLTQSL